MEIRRKTKKMATPWTEVHSRRALDAEALAPWSETRTSTVMKIPIEVERGLGEKTKPDDPVFALPDTTSITPLPLP